MAREVLIGVFVGDAQLGYIGNEGLTAEHIYHSMNGANQIDPTVLVEFLEFLNYDGFLPAMINKKRKKMLSMLGEDRQFDIRVIKDSEVGKTDEKEMVTIYRLERNGIFKLSI